MVRLNYAARADLADRFALLDEILERLMGINRPLTKSVQLGHVAKLSLSRGVTPMPRTKAPENMSHAELIELQAQIEKLILQRKDEAKAGLREKLAKLAEAEGMTLADVLGDGRRRGRGKGSVAIKYRDAAGNTWTGRGRMPRWMVAATRNGKVKKEDFLI